MTRIYHTLTKDRITKEISAKVHRPLTFKELSEVFDIQPKEINKFKGLVKELVLSGAIIKTRENRYALPEKVGLITGLVNAHPDGYAFITP